MAGMAVAAAPAVAVADEAAEAAAEPVPEATEEPTEAAADPAELATEEALLSRLLSLEDRDEAALPLAVASEEVMLARDEAMESVALDSALPMDERTEDPSERMELTRAVPLARMPVLVVVWAETAALRAATKTTE